MGAPLYIDVIDADTSDGGGLGQWRGYHPNAILVKSVVEMCYRVLTACNGGTLRRLRIFGHGDVGQQNLGAGHCLNCYTAQQQPGLAIYIDADGRLVPRDVLAMLSGRFDPDGLVQLRGCDVGGYLKGYLLLQQLSVLWKVRVQASIGDEYPDTRDRWASPAIAEANGMQLIFKPSYPRTKDEAYPYSE
jgi:hypothetical protein